MLLVPQTFFSCMTSRALEMKSSVYASIEKALFPGREKPCFDNDNDKNSCLSGVVDDVDDVVEEKDDGEERERHLVHLVAKLVHVGDPEMKRSMCYQLQKGRP